RQDRRWLSAHHAQLSGPTFRRATLPTDRLHQIAPNPDRSAAGSAPVDPQPSSSTGSKRPMTTASLDNTIPEAALHPPRNYLEDGTTLRSWLLTTDHKRIA